MRCKVPVSYTHLDVYKRQALDHAAEKGVEIKLLIDGIYQQLFLNGSKEFQALASRENVEIGVYNPVSPVGLFKLNYRMHDKYVIVDDKMYLLGGRNSNDIFLGDYTSDINVDRDILVCDTTNGKGESLQEPVSYTHLLMDLRWRSHYPTTHPLNLERLQAVITRIFAGWRVFFPLSMMSFLIR